MRAVSKPRPSIVRALIIEALLALSVPPVALAKAAPAAPNSRTADDEAAPLSPSRNSAQEAEVLLEKLWGLPSQPSEGGFTVCSSATVDLDGDGTPELVASVDYSGRRFCNTLVVLEKNNPQTAAQLDVWGVDDVQKVIQRFG